MFWVWLPIDTRRDEVHTGDVFSVSMLKVFDAALFHFDGLPNQETSTLFIGYTTIAMPMPMCCLLNLPLDT